MLHKARDSQEMLSINGVECNKMASGRFNRLFLGVAQVDLPAGITINSIKGGVANLSCDGVWEARLTLVPAPAQMPKPVEPAQVSHPLIEEGCMSGFEAPPTYASSTG
jgi:hypothetical protein